MISARNGRILLALGALTALGACSDISNRLGGSRTAAATAPQPMANEMVRQVQDRLQRDGYYKAGPVDGVWGTGTMNAVQAFQRDHDMNATGQLDVPTLKALNVADLGTTATATNPPPVGSTTYNGAPATTPSGSTAAPR